MPQIHRLIIIKKQFRDITFSNLNLQNNKYPVNRKSAEKLQMLQRIKSNKVTPVIL